MRFRALVFADDSLLKEQLEDQAAGADLELVSRGDPPPEGISLRELLETLKPSILLAVVETEAARMEEFSRAFRCLSYPCAAILCTPEPDSRRIRLALRCGFFDCLAIPLDPGELGRALLAAEIRLESDREAIIGLRHRESARQLFMTKTVFERDCYLQPLDRINHYFCTRFVLGSFQILLFRVDYIGNIRDLNAVMGDIQEKIIRNMERLLSFRVADILCDYLFEGLLVLVNYAESEAPGIDAALQPLLESCVRDISGFEGASLTLCAGGKYPTLDFMNRSKEEAIQASWSRLVKGTRRVLRYREPTALPDELAAALKKLNARCRSAITLLDGDSFGSCIAEFFTFPEAVLESDEARAWLNDAFNFIFDCHNSSIKLFADAEVTYTKINTALSFSPTLDAFRDNFITQLSDLMRGISEISDHRLHADVSRAIRFVEKNYGRNIGVQETAYEINRTPVYFSSLFKRETKQNFSEFITGYRITIAKRLLAESDSFVYEIARDVGYTDIQYFCKVFKKIVGMTPLQYRKNSGTSELLRAP